MDHEGKRKKRSTGTCPGMSNLRHKYKVNREKAHWPSKPALDGLFPTLFSQALAQHMLF